MNFKEDLIRFQSSKENHSLYTKTLHGPINKLILKAISCFYLSSIEAQDAAQELRLVFLREVIVRDFRTIERPEHWLFKAFRNHMINQVCAHRRKISFERWLTQLAAANEYQYQR